VASTLIALDLGTTSIKGAVLDLDARRIAHIERIPFPEPLGGLPDLFCEIDVAAVTRSTRQLIASLLAHASECGGLITCGQMGGLVLSDAQGQPQSNYISWRDQRLLMPHPSGDGSVWDHFERRLTANDWRELGHEVRPGLALSFLFWLRECAQLPSAPRGGASAPLIAASLPDFVLANLCGVHPATEITNAVGGVNVETRDWHRAVFAKLGLGYVSWSRLCDVRQVIGSVTIGGASIPCFAPVGDHQAALTGAFVAPGELSLNISTGSQASLLTEHLTLGDYQTRPFFDGQFLNTITHIPAGRALNVLVRLLTELSEAQHLPLADVWPTIARAVDETPDTDLGLDLAFFPSPVGSRGSITNIHEGNLTVGHVFRSAFQAMAKAYRTCALRLSPDETWQRIVFSGSLSQNLPTLRDMIARQFTCHSRLCTASEDTLLGLLVLALVATGRAPTVQAAMAAIRQES